MATPTGTTTQREAVVFPGESLKIVGTTTYLMRSTHVVAMPVSSGAQNLFGPFQMIPQSSLRDVIQIPINSSLGKMGMYVMYDLAASTDSWPIVAVRIPPTNSTRYSPDNTPGIVTPWMAQRRSTGAIGMGLPGGQSSVADSGWKFITSTAAYSGATSAALTYCMGPLDAAKYAIVPASSGDVGDKYQPYFEFIFGMTTGAPVGATSTMVTNGSGVTYSGFATGGLSSDLGSSAGKIFIMPFELPY